MEKTNEIELGFVDEEKIIPKIEKAIALKHNIALRGRTGTGKTFLIREYARHLGKKLYTLNMTVNTTTDELKGSYVLRPGKDGAMVGEWHDGSLVKAMREGAWVCIEEANFMREELASVMYSVMDNRRELILDEHEGEVIVAHSDFRLFLTMNWDYRGTVRPNDAIMNRINSWFDIDYLNEKNESGLLVSRTGVDKQIAINVARFATKIRAISEENNYPDLSTRILLNWAELCSSGMSPIEAAEMTAIPVIAYDKKTKSAVRNLAKAIFEVKKIDERDEDD